jgi:hypothetical protein
LAVVVNTDLKNFADEECNQCGCRRSEEKSQFSMATPQEVHLTK